MNAHQRRVARRKKGIRPPYTCIWCSHTNISLGTCGGCGEWLRPLIEAKLGDLAGKAYDKGFKLEVELVPKEK